MVEAVLVRPDCPILKPSKPDTPRTCWEPTCRGPLPKGAQKWCRDHRGQIDRWTTEHKWWAARPAALEDSRVECHRWAWTYLRQLIIERYWKWTCAGCGELTDAPEVDHVIPWRTHGGNRNAASCLNHSTNLRVLCHDCHVRKTVQDNRRERYSRGMDTTMERAGLEAIQLNLAVYE